MWVRLCRCRDAAGLVDLVDIVTGCAGTSRTRSGCSKPPSATAAAGPDRIITSFFGRIAMRTEWLAAVGDRMPGTPDKSRSPACWGGACDDDVRADEASLSVISYGSRTPR